ncbi:MAG: hypothetical protein K2R98_33680 [Gemmataceae bacterium]|nr:hypothetical protein [Gemmataceae bacterium]
MIRCVCQACGTAVEVSDNYAGARIACKQCKKLLVVAAEPAEPAAKPAAAAKAPAAPAAKPVAPPAKVPTSKPGVEAKPPTPSVPTPAAKPAAAVAKTPPSAPGVEVKPSVAAVAAPAKAPMPKPAPQVGKGPAPAVPAKAAPPKPAPAGPVAEAPPDIVPTLVMVEAIRFSCGHCKVMMHAWPHEVGAMVYCADCKQPVKVPAPISVEGDVAPAGAGVELALKVGPTPGSKPGLESKPPPAKAPVAAPAAAKSAPRPGALAVAKSIRFACTQCKSVIQVDATNAGLMTLCPKCKQNMPVPPMP